MNAESLHSHRTLRTSRPWAAPALLALSLVLPLASIGCADLVQTAGEDRNKGVQLYNAGNYSEAAGAFNSAIKQTPGDYRSHYYLGRSHEAQKAYQMALSSYRTALELSKRDYDTPERNDFQLMILDGLASAVAHGPGGGDADIAALQQKQPRTVEDQLLLAKIFKARGDVDSAIDAYNNAALVDPSNLPVAKEYGLYLVQIGHADKARPELKRAYVLNRRAGRPEDEKVVAALRGIGVVPGPSLGGERDLAQPPLPHGPLPEVDVSQLKLNPFVEDEPAKGSGATSSVDRQAP